MGEGRQNFNKKEESKMKQIKSQFLLCFLRERRVVTDASLASFGVDTDTVETLTLEVAGIFDTKLEALQELEKRAFTIREYDYTIIEKFQVEEKFGGIETVDDATEKEAK